MSLDSLNKWLSLTANIGVLLGILFLIIEINQNTRATRVEAEWSNANSYGSITNPIISDPEFNEIVIRFREMEEVEIMSAETMKNPDFNRFSAFVSTQVRHFQARYYIEDSADERQELRSTLLFYASRPGWRTIFETGVLSVSRPEFREFGLSIISEAKQRSNSEN